MGGKGSKIDAFYTLSINSFPPHKVEKKLVQTLKGLNVNITPRQNTEQPGPTLIIRDCVQESHLEQHVKDCWNLRPNELMVVLVPQVYPSLQSDRLVQLIWTKDDTDTSKKYENSLNSMVEFLKAGGRREESREPPGSGEESTGAVGGRDHSSLPADPVVHLAFGDTPDFLLREAVAFVEREGSIKLVESPNISYSSPLLVFCKNNTKLQEDIRHAIDNTRRGPDVMLIVVTDKCDIVLMDTEATKGIGAKAPLIYDNAKKKYRSSVNSTTMTWIRKFLGKYQIAVTPKLKRLDSIRRSFRRLRTDVAIGSYHVLGDLAEEQLKNVIVFLDGKDVVLAPVEVTAAESTSPLVLFCAGHQQPEQRIRGFMKTRKDHKDVYAVIIRRCSHEAPVIRGVYCDVSSLIIGDTSANVLDNAQNKNTVSALINFLTRQGASVRRPQRAKPQGDFLSSSGSEEGAGAAQSYEHLESGASSESAQSYEHLESGVSSESEATDLNDDLVCQTAGVPLSESAVDPIKYNVPFDEESPSRQMSSDSYTLWHSEDIRHRETTLDIREASQFHSTKPQYQYFSLDNSQLQPLEHVPYDSKQRIQQPIQSYPQHSPHVPLTESSCPAAQQPPHSLQLPDVSNVSILTSQQAGVPHRRPFPQATDTPQPNHWPQHEVCHTADTTESVDRDSVLSAAASQGQRRLRKGASWSKGRKHRPSVQQMRFEAQGAGDWTSTPGVRPSCGHGPRAHFVSDETTQPELGQYDVVKPGKDF